MLRRIGTTWALIAPGMLVAATGVGAGDLATAAFTGARLGVAVLWAVALGGVFKYALTEGLARWQLATGRTLLQGVADHAGRPAMVLFAPYLLLWSFFVGAALISASGATLHALLPVFEPFEGKVMWGAAASLAGLALVRGGGFRLFERTMAACIFVMVITVLVAAAKLWPGWRSVASGLLVPSIPDADAGGRTWTVALIGGVGGTVTILCYGYWIREKGREGLEWVRRSRIDLAAGYATTVVFGMAMLIIGAATEVSGSGAGLLVELGDVLGRAMGPWGRALFLVGAFGTVFSSLLGVWQAVPYLVADCWYLFMTEDPGVPLEETRPYRWFQVGLAIVPLAGLLASFRSMQLVYAVVGAAFIPILAAALLLMNGRREWVGDARNRWPSVLVLIGALAFFAVAGIASLG